MGKNYNMAHLWTTNLGTPHFDPFYTSTEKILDSSSLFRSVYFRPKVVRDPIFSYVTKNDNSLFHAKVEAHFSHLSFFSVWIPTNIVVLIGSIKPVKLKISTFTSQPRGDITDDIWFWICLTHIKKTRYFLEIWKHILITRSSATFTAGYYACHGWLGDWKNGNRLQKINISWTSVKVLWWLNGLK